jgi:hypothetical protein
MNSIDKTTRVELAGSGSTVEIASIPCQFHAAKCDVPDQLFVPLLSAAQQANDIMALRLGDEKAAQRAASYLAGELLRDNSFLPSRSWMTSPSHAYLIDLLGNRFQMEARVFNTSNDKSSSMYVLRVKGAIRGDKFVVVDPVTGVTLFSFTRFEAEKPDFFARDFPFIAQEARKNPSMFGGGNDVLADGLIDLMIGVPVDGRTVTVRIQKQAGALSFEVKHHPTNEVFMSMPLGALGNIPRLAEIVSRQLSANATAASPGS